jgi:hypothetical protein
MKESRNKTLESLFEKITESELPDWAKTTVVVSLALTPLFQILTPLLLLLLVANLLVKLLGI